MMLPCTAHVRLPEAHFTWIHHIQDENKGTAVQNSVYQCLFHGILETWGALECHSWFRSSCIGLRHAVHKLYLLILPMLTKMWQ